MGYYVRLLPRKKSIPNWKVQFISYKGSGKMAWDIRKDRWRALGFHPSMEIADSRARSRQLNAQLRLTRQEERVRAIQIAENEFRVKNDAVLPIEFVEEFELCFLKIREEGSKLSRTRRQKRLRVLWKAAQKMIRTLQIEPSEWFYHIHDIYDYFCTQELSLSYSLSILKFANLWGFFISRKLARPFLPVPVPKGYERQRIVEAFYQKVKGRRRPSLPLTPEHLANVSGKLNRANFNWLYLSVWLGLRPQEVDHLHNRALWSIETLSSGRKVLRVFQTKIVAIPPEDRWKPIPILYDEQEFALKIIADGNVRRPLQKTMRLHLGRGIDLYGGRKEFTDLMLSRRQTLENISVWMGHSTLARTWRSYKNKTAFQL